VRRCWQKRLISDAGGGPGDDRVGTKRREKWEGVETVWPDCRIHNSVAETNECQTFTFPDVSKERWQDVAVKTSRVKKMQGLNKKKK